jgi:metal-sulfur cluster biosynthetic enzyme/predicted DCC family thiol-disulfide oxidoreductase YuxK
VAPPRDRPLVIYDGTCGFCRGWIARLQGWDRQRRLDYLPLQDARAEELSGRSLSALGDAAHVVLPSGETLAGAAAFRAICAYLPGGVVPRAIFGLPGLPPLAEWAYRWIARRWGPAGARGVGATPRLELRSDATSMRGHDGTGAPMSVTEDQVRRSLRAVKDPELNLNIVDLGLVYDISVDDEGAVEVKMTLTSPGCPAGPEIMSEAEQVIRGIEGVADAQIELVWEPYWTPERIDPRVRAFLGL